jgi:signal transduction histidine kinase
MTEDRSWPVWWRRGRGLATLAAISVAVVLSPPTGGWTAPRLAVVVPALAVVVTGWLTWTFATLASRTMLAGIVAATAGGLVLAIAVPNSAALAIPAVAASFAATGLPVAGSIWLTGLASAAYLAGRAATVGLTGWALLGPGAFVAGLLVGLIRRQSIRLAEETRLAHEEQARAGALAERARLAREIHDVLAHALAALSVQLETADALLEGGRTAQARQSVARAGQLAREGLAETRRAIGTLRGEALPLTDMLAGLADGYRTDLGAAVTVRVEGEPRGLAAEATLALYRTAQEAMTNVRKHAPGAPVTLDLTYQPSDVELCVVNGPAPGGADPSLVHSGGGYGLTGLRERAELAGGRFRAEPTGDGYRVEIAIPAGVAS